MFLQHTVHYVWDLWRQQIEILCYLFIELILEFFFPSYLLRFVTGSEKLFYEKLYWYCKFRSFHLKGTNKQLLFHWDLLHSSKIYICQYFVFTPAELRSNYVQATKQAWRDYGLFLTSIFVFSFLFMSLYHQPQTKGTRTRSDCSPNSKLKF